MTSSSIPVNGTNPARALNTNVVTTSAGEVHNEIVEQYAFESTANTSVVPLGVAETFTGEWEQNSQECVMVSCQTDSPGTLFFDFSVDGVNATTFPTSGFDISGGTHEFHTAVKGPRYFRVRFVNGTAAQTYMRIFTYFGTFRASSTPLNQSISLDADAESVRPTDFQDEVRIGRRPGVNGWTKFAYRSALTAAGGEEIVWAATATFTPMVTPDTFTITYNSATDGSGTTGALSLYIQYVDSDGLPQAAVHTLGSTGSDVTAFSGLGINRAAVSSSGSAETNTNTITFTDTTGGGTQAVIPALHGVTQQSIFHVGSNHDGVAKFLWWNVIKPGGGQAQVLLKAYVYNRAIQTRFEVFRTQIDTQQQVTGQIDEPIGFNLSPSDILYFVADTDTNGASINLRFSLNEYRRT